MDDIITHIAVLLFGGYLGFWFDRKILKQQEIYRSNRDLIEAFTPALVELDPIFDIKEGYTHDTFSWNIVKNHFDKQKLAVYLYANYLGTNKKEEFMKAWNDYAYPYEDKFPGEFNDIGFDYRTVNPAEEPEIREKIRARINKIIEFAKSK